ncbi:hypothetical protein VTI28DRAFT_4348 [Corynascus sepedonium]
MPGGSLVGAVVSGWLSDRCDRKRAIMLGSGFWIVGSVLICASVNLTMLAVGLPSILASAFEPESPRWLLKKGREEEAQIVLGHLHGGGNVNAPSVRRELEELKATISEEYKHADASCLMCLWLSITAIIFGVYCRPPNPGEFASSSESMVVSGPAARLIIAATCLFVAIFAPTWSPVLWAYPPELFPLRLRGKAVALATSANWAVNFALTYFVPPAFENNIFGLDQA